MLLLILLIWLVFLNLIIIVVDIIAFIYMLWYMPDGDVGEILYFSIDFILMMIIDKFLYKLLFSIHFNNFIDKL